MLPFFLDENFPKKAIPFLIGKGHETLDIRGTPQEGLDDPYTAPCGGFPPGGLAETTFTFDDRRYKVRSGNGDRYLKVKGITKRFRVSLKFSPDPFPASPRPRSDGAGRAPLADRAWRGFQRMLVRDPGEHGWRLLDGRRSRER